MFDPLKVFISYAHEDEKALDALEKELASLRIDNQIDSWHMGRLIAGTAWDSEVRKNLGEADIVIMLISSHYVSSYYAYQVEHAEAMRKHQLGEAVVIPILISHTGGWKNLPFASVQLLPHGAKPVSEWRPQAKAWENIHDGIREAVSRLLERRNRDSDNHDTSGSTGEPTQSQPIILHGRPPMLEGLSKSVIDNLLTINSEEVIEPIQIVIKDALHSALTKYFAGHNGAFVNLSSLQTDAQVIILRYDTLDALMRAATKNTSYAFELAGAEAGVLYGVAVVKWCLEKSASRGRGKGLPRTPKDLVQTCISIDEASRWADEMEMAGFTKRRLNGYVFRMRIKGDFLLPSIREASLVDEPDSSRLHFAEARRIAFWKGYLEATFSTALSAWHGEWEEVDEDVPLLIANCSIDSGLPSNTDELHFKVELTAPAYETYLHLHKHILIPYISEHYREVTTAARPMIEAFTRELAGVESDTNNGRERVQDALTWLARNVDDGAKPAVSLLIRSRNASHTSHHVMVQPFPAKARQVLRVAVTALQMATRTIILSDERRDSLRKQLHPWESQASVVEDRSESATGDTA